MRLLTVSDEVIERLQSPSLPALVGAVDAIIGCGDLPPSYLEHLVTVLHVPCFYVHGNHDAPELRADGSRLLKPRGCDELNLRVVNLNGLLIAGIDGVLWYRDGDFQYSERAWFWRLKLLALRVFLAQQRYGRKLDLLVTHTPPQGLHDGPGAHRGPLALRRFIERVQPRYVLHGHVHLNYGYGDQSPLQHAETLIINTCGYKIVEIEPVEALHKVSVG